MHAAAVRRGWAVLSGVGKIGTTAGFQSSAGKPKEEQMKLAVIALSTAAVIASSPALFAKDISSRTPGHAMQKY